MPTIYSHGIVVFLINGMYVIHIIAPTRIGLDLAESLLSRTRKFFSSSHVCVCVKPTCNRTDLISSRLRPFFTSHTFRNQITTPNASNLFYHLPLNPTNVTTIFGSNVCTAETLREQRGSRNKNPSRMIQCPSFFLLSTNVVYSQRKHTPHNTVRMHVISNKTGKSSSFVVCQLEQIPYLYDTHLSQIIFSSICSPSPLFLVFLALFSHFQFQLSKEYHIHTSHSTSSCSCELLKMKTYLAHNFRSSIVGGKEGKRRKKRMKSLIDYIE